jgi:hypothetical protein
VLGSDAMLRTLLTTLGIGLVANSSAVATEMYRPYATPHANVLYNLLFCDDLGLFKTHLEGAKGGPWPALLAEQTNKAALRRIASDETNEGRVRALAYNRLRAAGDNVPPKKLLGVIVEVPLEQGLDVLAAFSEGGVRYLNQSGKVAVFEGTGNPLGGLAKDLVTVSQPVVNQTGPWDKQRLPPPTAGNVRMTFLVSDGLYFGEGGFAALQQDAMAGPILATAARLLQRAVELGTK